MSLKSKAYSGLKWSALNSGSISIFSFVRLWVLACLLSPEDFGLMAMVLTVIELANAYTDTGMSAAIIHRQDASQNELSSLYWLNVATGVAIFLFVWMLTPFVAMFYREPRLNILLPVSSLTLVISSFSNQFTVLLQRDVQFPILAKQEIISVFLGTTVAVLTALAGQNVWSLVWGQLTSVASKTTFLVIVGFKRYRPHMHFCRKDLKGYLGFGFYQMADRTINYLSGRMDQLLIGNLLGAEILGYYNFAFNLVMQPLFKINSVITVVMFPVFAKMQDDLDRLRKSFLDLVHFIFSINAPLLVGVACVAPTLITTLFGQKWSNSVIFIQILAFVALLRSTNDPIASIGLAKGRADILFRWNLYAVIANFLFMYVGFKFMNAIGIAVALLAVRTLIAPFNYWYIVRPTVGRCGNAYLRSIFMPIGLALLMGASVVLLGSSVEGTPLYLLKTILFGACVYILLLVFVDREIIVKIRNLVC